MHNLIIAHAKKKKPKLTETMAIPPDRPCTHPDPRGILSPRCNPIRHPSVEIAPFFFVRVDVHLYSIMVCSQKYIRKGLKRRANDAI